MELRLQFQEVPLITRAVVRAVPALIVLTQLDLLLDPLVPAVELDPLVRRPQETARSILAAVAAVDLILPERALTLLETAVQVLLFSNTQPLTQSQSARV
jgi:hypothetical protein